MSPRTSDQKGPLLLGSQCRTRTNEAARCTRQLSEVRHMMIGYARVSTEDQCTDLRTSALGAAGCNQIFEDVGISGSLASRPALDEAIDCLRPGDTLVTWKLDRLGRSLSHLISLVTTLEARGV